MTKQLEALTLRRWSTQAVLPSAMHRSELQGFLVSLSYSILVNVLQYFSTCMGSNTLSDTAVLG